MIQIVLHKLLPIYEQSKLFKIVIIKYDFRESQIVFKDFGNLNKKMFIHFKGKTWNEHPLFVNPFNPSSLQNNNFKKLLKNQ